MAGLSETNGFGKKRIMIVDHNEEEQKTVKKMLGEEYEVLVAETYSRRTDEIEDQTTALYCTAGTGNLDFSVDITVTS